ncbi:TPA: hypothetical protein HA318_01785, partial [Candidatus Micrarchaeota archaeon]|nr:hypothetical protein [Candidatus Micrarchaeota archaeon]
MRQETRKPTNWRTTIRQALGTRAQEYERGSNELFKRLAQKHGGKAESTRANALETLHEHASLFDCLLPKESIDAAIHAATRPHLPAA